MIRVFVWLRVEDTCTVTKQVFQFASQLDSKSVKTLSVKIPVCLWVDVTSGILKLTLPILKTVFQFRKPFFIREIVSEKSGGTIL